MQHSKDHTESWEPRCSLVSSSVDCLDNICSDRMNTLNEWRGSKEDFYAQLLELKRRNERRLKQLESQFKRRHSEAFDEGYYIYGECCCRTADEILEQREESEQKSRKRRTQSAPAPQKKPKTLIIPFSMTLREEERCREKLMLVTKSTDVHQNDPEEETYERNFKASSVPKHVSKPLFRNMVLQHPQRYGGPKMSKYLHSTINKSKSMSDLSHFRAKPFPNHIFTDYALERMKEAEEYRRVRRETRQKALLNEASFPSRMKSELEEFKGKLRKNSEKEPKKRARMKAIRSHNVPDFDLLYSKFQKSLDLKKMTGRSSTVIEPFSFDGKYSKSATLDTFNQGVSQSRHSFCKPAPITFKPTGGRGKMTNAARLREIANRRRIQSLEHDSQKRQVEKEQLSLRQKELRRHPDWNRRLHDQPNTKEEIRFRMLQRMEDEKERMLSYKMELKRIYSKIESRPPLFIRQSQQCEAQKVERVYNNALSREGLTEREILEFLSGRGRSRSYDSLPLGRAVNLTYSKSSSNSSIMSGSVCLEDFDHPSGICRDHRELCSLNSQKV